MHFVNSLPLFTVRMNFIEYLQSHSLSSGRSLNELKTLVRSKTYVKKESVLPVENRSGNLYFIEKGFARVFYFRESKDVTLYFLGENKIGLPVDSIFYNEVCKFGIEALTETKVNVLAYRDWELIMQSEPGLQQLAFRLMVEYIKKANDRIYNIKFQTPRERYQGLLAEFPAIGQHAPLGHIASYLGITLETLSRLRSAGI